MARKLSMVEVAAAAGLVYIFRDELRALAGTRFGTPPTPDDGGDGGDGGVPRPQNGDGGGGGGGGGVSRPLTLDGIRRSLLR